MSDNADLSEDEIDALHARLRRARKPFEDAHEHVVELTNRLKTVLNGLETDDYRTGRKSVRPRYVPGASEWVENLPTEKEVIEGLLSWYEARETLRGAYSALPENEKRNVKELPRAAQDN